MENIDLNIETLYGEVKERAEAEGAASREEWNDLVQEVLDEKREFGEIHDDEDVSELREVLQARYEDFESGVEEM